MYTYYIYTARLVLEWLKLAQYTVPYGQETFERENHHKFCWLKSISMKFPFSMLYPSLAFCENLVHKMLTFDRSAKFFLPSKVSHYTLTGAPTMGMARHNLHPIYTRTRSWTNHCSSIDETNNFNHLTVHWGQYSIPIIQVHLHLH